MRDGTRLGVAQHCDVPGCCLLHERGDEPGPVYLLDDTYRTAGPVTATPPPPRASWVVRLLCAVFGHLRSPTCRHGCCRGPCERCGR